MIKKGGGNKIVNFLISCSLLFCFSVFVERKITLITDCLHLSQEHGTAEGWRGGDGGG